MKLTRIFAALAVAVLATSCGILGGSTSTAASATTSGQTSGAALKNLYTQYKTDGKVDMTNLNNILNLATLSTGVQELKADGTDKTAYLKDFATGLVIGSQNLVTPTNSTSVVSELTNLAGVDLSAVTTAATALVASGAVSAQNTATAAQSQAAAAQAQTAQAQASAASSATSIASTLAQVGAASTEVSSAVSSLSNIFSLFK